MKDKRKVGGRWRTKNKTVKGREGLGAMGNKLKAVYLKGYQAAVKSIIKNLKEQEEKVEAEIERCVTKEDE